MRSCLEHTSEADAFQGPNPRGLQCVRGSKALKLEESSEVPALRGGPRLPEALAGAGRAWLYGAASAGRGAAAGAVAGHLSLPKRVKPVDVLRTPTSSPWRPCF